MYENNLSLAYNAVWRLFPLLWNNGKAVQNLLSLVARGHFVLNDLWPPLLWECTHWPLTSIAMVCNEGGGEPKNLDLKLTLTIFFENICEFHKISLDGTYKSTFLGCHVCSFWPALKYFKRVKRYRLEPEFCALYEYGLRNFVSVFVQEQWRKPWKILKTTFMTHKQIFASPYTQGGNSVLK